MPRLVRLRPRPPASGLIVILGFFAIAAILARPCPAQDGRSATKSRPTASQGGDASLVPPPEVVNAETFTREPADALDGPPFTTVKAWAIADGATGEVLWGRREKDILEMASTTKIMTALIVVRLMAKDPKVGDEMVTFSRRADETIGSSSEVREGEQLPVRELLYGLLLPSGNDASVAFAEHFGGSLEPSVKGAKNEQSLDRFVAEMNRVAQELGLHETHFENPNGLPAPGHHSSARDLCRLAAHAMRQPAFAAVVGTRRHGCAVVARDGKRRNVAWTNTNHLLEVEGYDGIKTGTTRAAGTCLVASGHRGADHLIVVVLGGSSSPDSRYPDARNLFRWAWQKRERRSETPHAGTAR
ncbi:MAG: D-alanyl-D-alanine carboxypeptidase family protein [Isosphaeraceae bacterium]